MLCLMVDVLRRRISCTGSDLPCHSNTSSNNLLNHHAIGCTSVSKGAQLTPLIAQSRDRSLTVVENSRYPSGAVSDPVSARTLVTRWNCLKSVYWNAIRSSGPSLEASYIVEIPSACAGSQAPNTSVLPSKWSTNRPQHRPPSRRSWRRLVWAKVAVERKPLVIFMPGAMGGTLPARRIVAGWAADASELGFHAAPIIERPRRDSPTTRALSISRVQ